MTEAVSDKRDDGTSMGLVPAGFGIVALGATLRPCEDEGRSILEEWILLGLERGQELPDFGGIDLNKEPLVEPVDAW